MLSETIDSACSFKPSIQSYPTCVAIFSYHIFKKLVCVLVVL